MYCYWETKFSIMKFGFVFLFFVFTIQSLFPIDKEKEARILKEYIPVLDEKLKENSGLIYWKDFLWTINDSGGKNELYAIDIQTGNIIITVKITNVDNIDWESLTQDEHFIYIGDFGNNFGSRTDLKVFKIDKKYISNSSNQVVKAETISIQYEKQKSFVKTRKETSFDCEGFVSYNDQLILFSKDWKNAKAMAYVFPKETGSYKLKSDQNFDVNMYVTGASISADGKLALLGYYEFKSFIWIFDIHEDNFFTNPKKIDLSYIGYAQTESICFMGKNKLLISCEETENCKAQIWEVNKKYWK